MRYIIGLIIILFSANSYAQRGYKDGKFDASGINSLTIEIYAGMAIKISGEDGLQEISYEYLFEGSEIAYKRLFDQFNPEYELDGGEASLEIKFPDIRLKNQDYEIKRIELNLRVPSDIILDLETKYSEISVANIKREVDIVNRSGLIRLIDIGQSIDIENSYGNVSAIRINGDVDIESRSSTLDIKNITGDVDIESNYSKMNISEIDGDVDIENKSGVINAFNIRGDFYSVGDYSVHELTNIDGDVDIETRSSTFSLDGANSLAFEGDYTKMYVNNITGDGGVDIANRSSDLKISNIAGTTNFEGSYMNIELESIQGPVSIENRTGKVSAKNISGYQIVIEGEYLEIDLEDFNGDMIEIYNKSGKNNLKTTGDLSQVYIESQYGDVNLYIKNVFNGLIDLSTNYGKIKSDFEYTTSESESKDKNSIIKGSMGDGNDSNRMKIDVSNGNINIKKNK